MFIKKVSGLLVLGLALLGVFRVTVAAQPPNAIITDCTNDTQLATAVALGGVITFNCGAGTHTIPVSTYMQVPNNTTIHGGDQITLDGGDLVAFFQVYASAEMTLTHMTLQNGRFSAAHPLENFGTLNLDNVTMRDNESFAEGGAIANYGILNVVNSTFENNIATTSGGAIFSQVMTATVSGSTFRGNHMSGATGNGGAISADSGYFKIEESSFSENGALDGGALFVGSTAVVEVNKSSLSNNTAGYGGAIESTGQLDVNNSTLTNNHATVGDGGAIWVLGSDTDLAYVTIDGNTAATTGGGVSCNSVALSIIFSTVSHNEAGTTGAGIYSSCNLNVTNDTFSGNTAVGGGGGIYQAVSGVATVGASTFANNSAVFGAGVYNDGAGSSTLSLQQTMLANNHTGNCDGVITSLGYNLSSDSNCAALLQTGDQQGLTTLFLSPLGANGGPTFTHYPLVGNPAINAIPSGSCAFSLDQRGISRPQFGACDAGAVEVDRYWVYLPVVIE